MNFNFNYLPLIMMFSSILILFTLFNTVHGDTQLFVTKYVGSFENLPNPRDVSNALGQQTKSGNPDKISSLFMYLGQFIDHDISLTPVDNSKPNPIPLNKKDPLKKWNKNGTMEFFKSQRQLRNINTNRLDLSSVYGDTQERLDLIRDGCSPFLKTSNNGKLMHRDEKGNFICGDGRCNENSILIGFHTLFVLEHNRLAKKIQKRKPHLTHEEVFRKARRRNIHQYQTILYEEWLPLLLGLKQFPHKKVPLFSDTYFSTVTFRFGHSMIPNHLLYDDKKETLFDNFFRPDKITNSSVLTKYMVGIQKVQQEEHDLEMVDSLRNHLFPNSQRRLDLFSLNVQRGRDHHLGSYLQYSTIYCKRPKSIMCFYKITKDMELAKKLKTLYGSANRIDNFVGILAEPRFRKSLVGKTATLSILRQFQALGFDYQPKKYKTKTLKQLFKIHFESITQDIFHV